MRGAGSLPAAEGVARVARERKIRGPMIRTIRRVVIIQVARNAGRVEARVCTARCSLMAGLAVRRRMRAHQGEPVRVKLDRGYTDAPAAGRGRVAHLARRSELPPVNIRVTTCTIRCRFLEYRAHVALRTSHVLVHAGQRIFRIAPVIKLQFGPKRSP